MRFWRDLTASEGDVKRGFFFLSWPFLLCCLGIVVVVMKGAWLFGDGDTHWHLAVAKWMIEHLQVMDRDVFSYTMPGVGWHSHEWLSALILYGVYQIASWPGLIFLAGIAYICSLGLISRFLFGRLDPAYAILLTVVSGASIAVHLLARPHILALPILVWWAIQCIKAVDGSRAPDWKSIPLMVLWANMHGSFVVGLGLVAVFGVEAYLQADNSESRMRTIRSWGSFLGVAVLASLVSPHGVYGLIFPFQVSNMTYALGVIGEWQSPNFQRLTLQEIWILGVLGFSVILGLRIPLVRAILLLALIHMSLKHVRHITLLGALGPLLIAAPLAVALKVLQSGRQHAAGFDRFLAKGVTLANPVLGGAFLVAALAAALAFTPRSLSPPQQTAPVDALSAAKKLGLSGNVFNGYSFGGYLIYSGVPTFIDGRADMYGDEFLKNATEAYRAKPGKLLSLLDQYNVGWTLLAPDTAAISVLDGNHGWTRVYSDEYAVIHQRIDPAD